MAKSKYETHVKPYFDDIFYWRSHDWDLSRIALELGVAESTFMKYKKEIPELSELLKKADKSKPRNIALKAEKALKDKLVDREFEEVHTEQWVDNNGKVTKKHIKKVKKTIPADTTAVIFALKSNDRERYGERDLLDKRIELLEKQIEKLKVELDDGYDPTEEQTIIVDDIPVIESEVESNGNESREETSD
ncbi:hypothetical protein P7H46_11070 [Enterococcus pseudoavium]|uniref:Small subunit of terminase n=1 Tax=Enterococcus pseudoavium TaxID=44007 RepID=A0ABU3FJZ1_9ENTE|nr:hypothetical protein [Enterococcus pseudoavium]MDT2771382.1 hypothetical protein [Enterococcus pseudoavium]